MPRKTEQKPDPQRKKERCDKEHKGFFGNTCGKCYRMKNHDGKHKCDGCLGDF
jgi:hypothetical protein